MNIIPAIDLIDGKCVRLTEGDYSSKKTYDEDPIKIALGFKSAGARIIHIIDLDGAKTGQSKNRDIIKHVKKITGLTIQTGGGIRSEGDVKELIDAGIDFLILGTILIENLSVVRNWIDKHKDKFIAGIDVKDNIIKTRGWENDCGINAVKFGKELFQIGFKTAVYTDIFKDGKLEGPNIEETKKFSEQTGLKIILSGGISSEIDIKKVCDLNFKGITGIIIGKAIYEGKINLPEIISRYNR